MAALSDVLYKDYFIDTKRNVLDWVNNRVLYEVFPKNKLGTIPNYKYYITNQ